VSDAPPDHAPAQGKGLLSSIILNWNRARLLRRTVESYLATTRGEQIELFIIDNASTDGSRDYLSELGRSHPEIKITRLAENIGGEAYNLAIAAANGELIHLSENDQEFLPGWLAHVWDAFDAFPDLGQLSLHHDIPTDEEAWEPKPSKLRFASRKILYEAQGNVGTSSILRGCIFRDHGVRVRTLGHGPMKFPADAELSSAVKKAGYWAAWSDRYYVRNLGHLMEEFERDPEYYRHGYASKPWLGEAGWRARMDAQRRLPKPIRRSLVLPEAPAVPERTQPPVGDKPARIWSMFDGWTAEVEVLDFLYALVRLVKPAAAVETGAWLGWSACAMAKAMRANGFGRLVALDINAEALGLAQKHAKANTVDGIIDFRLENSLTYTPQEQFELALLDSDAALREAEFRRFQPWFAPGATIVFHDTASDRGVMDEGVRRLVGEGLLRGVELPTPRGLFLGRARTP
jgi:predicted O-methyltransferase YrrM